MPITEVYSDIKTSQTALQSSIAGAHRAEQKVAEAGIDIINGFANAANELTEQLQGTTSLSSETISATTQAKEILDTTAEAAPDPVRAMIDMKIGQHAYAASLKVFTAVDEMQKALLDMKA